MACMKVNGGWRIRLASGKWFPKLYRTKALCEIREDQMARHDTRDDKKPI